MIKQVLSTAKRVLSESPNYQVNFTDRDPLKVHLGTPQKVRTFHGIVYRWMLKEEDILIRCVVKKNKNAFDAKKTFEAFVRVGGKKVGSLTIQKI